MTPKQVESLREGLRRNVRMGETLENAQGTADALLILLRRDWSTRVLDAWALAPERGQLAHPVPSPRPEWGEGWYVPWGGKRYYGATPDAARHAAAVAIWPELSHEQRQEIGPCP